MIICRIPLTCRFWKKISLSVVGITTPTKAFSHATGQSFIALLPTGPYIALGVLIVALSLMLVWFLPFQVPYKLFKKINLIEFRINSSTQEISSFISFLFVVWGIQTGLNGTRDPLENPLTLGFWVAFWMAAPMIQGYLFNLWGWISPWQWAVKPLTILLSRPWLKLPDQAGILPAVAILLMFSAFTLADPAPDDPARLASVLTVYMTMTFSGMVVFGPERWLERVEFFSVMMVQLKRLALFAQRGDKLCAGWLGWQFKDNIKIFRGISIFILVLLGTGSFDGLNETFFWFDQIGVNPLDFPGRSAVVIPVVIGLLSANLILIGLFIIMITIGNRLASGHLNTTTLLNAFAPTVLPIALAYHTAHYLPSLLVEGQYVLLALNDPLGNGFNLLGLDGFYVTTGFFNHRETVRLIWLSQAFVITLGHVISVILAHLESVRIYGDSVRAVYAGLPVAIFMVLYTWLGLWLLAAPKIS